jgi:hypothetical protein
LIIPTVWGWFMSDKKVCIYSAIYGAYDVLREPVEQSIECDFIMFTDNKELSELKDKTKWEVKYVPWQFGHPRHNAKCPKLNPDIVLPEYDIVIWVDGDMEITSPDYAKIWIDLLEESDEPIAFVKHWMRDCVYEEMHAACRVRKYEDIVKMIYSQLTQYRKIGIPEHWGLYACTSFARDNRSPLVHRLNRTWWRLNFEENYFDQITLIRVMWETLGQYKAPTLDYDTWRPLFNLYEHHEN